MQSVGTYLCHSLQSTQLLYKGVGGRNMFLRQPSRLPNDLTLDSYRGRPSVTNECLAAQGPNLCRQSHTPTRLVHLSCAMQRVRHGTQAHHKGGSVEARHEHQRDCDLPNEAALHGAELGGGWLARVLEHAR